MMVRCLAVSVLSIALAAGARFYRDSGPSPSAVIHTLDDPSAVPPGPLRDQLQELHERQARRNTFARFLRQVTAELAAGTADLRTATDRMFFFCLERYPEHLENVDLAEHPAYVKLGLAVNLLRELRLAREIGERGPDLDATLARLDGELAAMADSGAAPAGPAARY